MPVARTLSLFACAVAVAVCGSPVGAAPPDAADPGAGGGYLGAVTLISGDRVSVRKVGERLVPTVEPGAGREHVHFATTGSGDALSVVPQDAWAEIGAGRLDARLFDVAALLRDGYGDDRRGDVPLILRTGAQVAAAEMSTSDFKTLSQPKGSAADFWKGLHGSVLASAGDRVWLDGVRKPSLDKSVAQIGAPEAWRGGLTGKGVAVAVLDTGVDLTHPDLVDRIDRTRSFVKENVIDKDGHGTHVASTIAGTGRASEGKYRGVAPDARLLIGKVCDGTGCPESAILKGMAWAAESGAAVANLSLGGPDTAAEDPLEAAVNDLSARHGTLFVIAAGNDGGYGAETVASPASADAALAVGAVDREDVVADFSSRGPRLRDAAVKPEITAPGVGIVAAKSRFAGPGKEKYTQLSGTSMASPHVAGAAAILAQAHPDWTGAQLKDALMGSAKSVDGSGGFEQGAGRVDVARAVKQTVYADTPSVSLGRQAWPHADDKPVTKPIVYRNAGTAPVTLALSLKATGPAGEAAPSGMFRLSTDRVTVPAGGTAEVQITADTALEAAEGAFTARVQAESGTQRVTTPAVVDREPESYDLTVRTIDRNGKPTDANYTFLLGVDISRYRPIYTVDGQNTVRVRKGTYHIDAAINTLRSDGLTDTHKVVRPTVPVTADTTVEVKASEAKPITVTFARPGVKPRAVGAGYSRSAQDRAVSTGVLGDDLSRINLGQVGAPIPDDELIADIGGAWLIPAQRDDTRDATTIYHLAWYGYGQVANGVTKHVVDKDLAAVQSTYRAQAKGKYGTKVWIAREPRYGAGTGFGLPTLLPITRTEYHNADGPTWTPEFQQWSTKDKITTTETTETATATPHTPGKTYQEDWNTAVIGPNVTAGEWAARYGDSLSFYLPLHTDSGPNHAGTSLVDTASTTLYQGDKKIAETKTPGQASADVPPERTTFRLDTTATRSTVSNYSTTITATWTFTSQRPEPPTRRKEGIPVPLMAIRYTPPTLNQDNRTTADNLTLPITVQWPKGIKDPALTTLTLETSADDGKTWTPTAVTLTSATTATAHIAHPAKATYISLRAKAKDTEGNTTEQTIIRAYGI